MTAKNPWNTRANPPLAQPAIGFEPAASGALRFGGYPRLPLHIDWPCLDAATPLHFLAEIDLAALPREMEQAGHHYRMPDGPTFGRLFIFLALNGDMVYHADPVACYAPDADDSTPYRQPPTELPFLDPEDAYAFHPEAVAEDGCSLKTGYLAASAYLSTRAENPLWRNMDRGNVSEDEIYARDKAYADQLAALGIDYHVPLPRPEATREAMFDEIPRYYQGFFSRGVFQWTWEYIFEVSKRAYMGCYDLALEELETWKEDGDSDPKLEKHMAKLAGKKAKVQAGQFTDRPGWWESISCDHSPSQRIRLDVQLARWMRYARVSRQKPLTDTDKREFLAMLAFAGGEDDLDKLADLAVLGRLGGHRVRAFVLEFTLRDAFLNVAKTRMDLHPGRDPEPKMNFGDEDRAARIVQMFGAGYLLQNAAIEHEDKVLLFQLSDACGVEMTDGIMQMWITAEDLAAARFDRVITTMEST